MDIFISDPRRGKTKYEDPYTKVMENPKQKQAPLPADLIAKKGTNPDDTMLGGPNGLGGAPGASTTSLEKRVAVPQ